MMKQGIVARKYTFLWVLFMELVFIYFEIDAILRTDYEIPSLFWLSLVIKCLLGYAMFRLYITCKSGLMWLGAILAVFVIAATYIIYYACSDEISRIIGGPYVFFLVTNSLFLYWYLRHPEVILEIIERGGKINVFVIPVIVLMYIFYDIRFIYVIGAMLSIILTHSAIMRAFSLQNKST